MEIVLADHRFVVCTPNHEFFTTRGLVAAESLSYDDFLFSGKEWSWQLVTWILKGAGTTGIHEAITASCQPENKNAKGLRNDSFIATCGKALSVKFRQSMKFITSMATRAITISTTLPVYTGANISVCTGQKAANGPLRGTQPNRDNDIILRSPSSVGEPTEKKHWAMPLRRFPQLNRQPQNGIEIPPITSLTSKQVENPGLSAKPLSAFARFAVRTFLRIGRALNSAGRIVELKTFEHDTAVYDLTVEGDHCFVANGILVSNSHASEAYCYGAAMLQQEIPKVKAELIPIKGMTAGHRTEQTLDQLWDEHKRRASARRKI